MSLHGAPMLRCYWQKVGGVLIEEFPDVQRAADRGARREGSRRVTLYANTASRF